MFVDTSRAAITEDGEIDPKSVTPDMNVMFIRKKMDFGTRSKVHSAAMKLSGGTADLDIGAYQLALAQHNILDWSGPDFQGIPCTPANIARLDPDEPLFQRTLEAIAARNPAGGSDPKASTPAGAVNGVARS